MLLVRRMSILAGIDILGNILPVLLPHMFCSFTIGQTPHVLSRIECPACCQRCRNHQPFTTKRHRTSFRKHHSPHTRRVHLIYVFIHVACSVHRSGLVRMG